MPRCSALVKHNKCECTRSTTLASGLCWQHANIQEKLDDCPICLDKMQPEQSIIKLLVCGHRFHSKCMSIWTSSKDTCPLCRTNVSMLDIMKLSHNRAAGVNAKVSSLPPLLRSSIWNSLDEFLDHLTSPSHELDFIPVNH